jgi:CRISPR-associated endonuclease/helicase Cas3
VLDQVAAALSLLPLERYRDAITMAAALHDWGKADWRFQALLRSSSVFAAMASGVVLAKSGSLNSSLAARGEARKRAELPDGFRHEMLSVEILVHCYRDLITHGASDPDDLLLHLIATHHGHARPFAPVVRDDPADDQLLTIESDGLTINPQQRKAWTPSHRLDSGIAERFWKLTRTHGWWGLAWLESILRLADQQASAAEQQGMTR